MYTHARLFNVGFFFLLCIVCVPVFFVNLRMFLTRSVFYCGTVFRLKEVFKVLVLLLLVYSFPTDVVVDMMFCFFGYDVVGVDIGGCYLLLLVLVGE